MTNQNPTSNCCNAEIKTDGGSKTVVQKWSRNGLLTCAKCGELCDAKKQLGEDLYNYLINNIS